MKAIIWLVFLALCYQAFFTPDPWAGVYYGAMALVWFSGLTVATMFDRKIGELQQDMQRMADELERIVAEAEDVSGSPRESWGEQMDRRLDARDCPPPPP